MPTALTAAQTRFLRGQAHDLRAMLQAGAKGVSEALVAEVDLALEQHERVIGTVVVELHGPACARQRGSTIRRLSFEGR